MPGAEESVMMGDFKQVRLPVRTVEPFSACRAYERSLFSLQSTLRPLSNARLWQYLESRSHFPPFIRA